MPSLFNRLWNRGTEPEPEPGGLYSPPERGAPDPEPSDFNVGDVVVSAGREQSGAPAVADERRRALSDPFVLPDGIDGTVKGVDKDLLFVAFGINIDPRELEQEPGTEPEAGQVFKAPQGGIETPAGRLPRGTRLFFLGAPDNTTWRMRTMLHFNKDDFFNKQLPERRKWGMPKVWRVENEQGKGPYRGEEGPKHLGWSLLDLMNATYPEGRQPHPQLDFDEVGRQRIVDGDTFFGFSTEEDAVRWFGREDLADLAERGFKLVEVDADEVIPSLSGKQVIFTRAAAPRCAAVSDLASGDNLRRIYELEYKLYLLSQADPGKGVRWTQERVEKRRERYRTELESRIQTEAAFLADQFDDWLRAHAQYYLEEGEAETEEEAYQMTRHEFPEIAGAQRALASGHIDTPHELNEIIQIAHVNGRMADRIYTNGWDLLNELSNLDENILGDWRRTAMLSGDGGRNLKKHGPIKQAQLIHPSSLYQHRDGTVWFVTDAQPRQFKSGRRTTTFSFDSHKQQVDFFASREDAIEAAKARDEYAIRAERFVRVRVNELGDNTVIAKRMFIEYAPDENRTQLRGEPDEWYVMSGVDFGYGLGQPRDVSHVKKIYELELEITKLKQQPQSPFQRIEKMEQRLERMLDTEIAHLKRFMELWRDYDIDREMHSMNVQRAISDMENASTLGEKLAAFNFALNVAHTNGKMAEYMYGSGAPKLLTEFSRMAKRAQAESAQLVALHGLRAPALLHAVKTGGLVAPSIAITKLGQDFSRYGDIILVAPPELVDPADVPVYNADVYSPRYPNMRYAPDKRKLNKLYKDLDPYIKETEEYISDIDYFFDRGGAEEILNRASAALKLRFLREVKGIDVERVMVENQINPEWVKSPSWDAFMQSDYAAWKKADDELPVRERFESPEYQRLSQAMAAAIREWAQSATDEPELQQYLEEAERKQYMSGDRASYGPLHRVFEAYRKIGGQTLDRGAFAERIDEAVEPHAEEFARWYDELTEGTVKHEYFHTPGGAKRKKTPENILKHLTHKTKGGEGFNYGLGSVRAQGAKKFRSWNQMLKASDQIVSHEEMEAVQENLNERFFNLAERLEGSSDMHRLDGFAEAVREAYKRGRSLRRELERSGLSADQETIRDIYQFMDELRTAPTEYFEAKPQRVVDLHEFIGAAVPEDVDPRVLEVLQEENLRVVQYPEGGRAQAIAELAGGHTRGAHRRRANDEPARGAFEWGGLPISIEHFAGDERWNGKVAPCMYGYFPNTLAMDGDAVDVLIGPDHKDDDCPVWVVEQLDPQGKSELRQYKTFIGFRDEDAVRECFLTLWSEDMLGDIESCPADEYRDVWLRELDISRQEACRHEHEEDGSSVQEVRGDQRSGLSDRYGHGRGRLQNRDLRGRGVRAGGTRQLQASGNGLLWSRPRRPQNALKRTAGRLQDVKAKYPEMAAAGHVDQLSKLDPSGNNKYLPWMAARLARQVEIHGARHADSIVEEIGETVKLFHKNLDRMEPSERDINQYDSITHADMVAERAAQKLTQKERRDRAKQGAEVVYRDGAIRIMQVKSHEASCFYGKGTRWCITQEDDPGYFDDYTKNAHMYFVIESPGAMHEQRNNAIEQFEELLERLFYERRGSDAKLPNINSEIEAAKAAQNLKELRKALTIAHVKINQATPNVDSAGPETLAALQDAKQTAIKSFPRKWAVNVRPDFQSGGLDYAIYDEEDHRVSESRFPYMDKFKELVTREDAPKLPRRKFFVTPFREPEEVLQVFEDEKAAQRWASDNRADVGYGIYSGLYLDDERLDDDPRWVWASKGESVPVVAFDSEQPHWAPKSELSSTEITDELLEEHNATSAKSGYVDGYQIHRSRTDMRIPRLAPGQPVVHSSLRQAAGVVNLQGYDEQLARMILQGEAPDRLRDVFPEGFLQNPEADARFRKMWFDVTEQPNAKVRAVFLKPSDEWDSGRIILNTANLPPDKQLQRIRTALAHELRHAADWAYTGLRDDTDKYRWTMQEGVEDDVQYVNNSSEMRSLAGDVADLLYGIYGRDVTQLKGVALVRSIREDTPYVWNNLEPENRRPFLQRVMKALEQRLEQAA